MHKHEELAGNEPGKLQAAPAVTPLEIAPAAGQLETAGVTLPELFEPERLARLADAAARVCAIGQPYASTTLRPHNPNQIKLSEPDWPLDTQLSHATVLEDENPQALINLAEISHWRPGGRRVISDEQLDKVYLRELFELAAGQSRALRVAGQRPRPLVRHGFTQIARNQNFTVAAWLTNGYIEELAEQQYRDLHAGSPSGYVPFGEERRHLDLLRNWLQARNPDAPVAAHLQAQFFSHRPELDFSPYLGRDLSTEQFFLLLQAPDTFCPDPAARNQAFQRLFGSPKLGHIHQQVLSDMLLARKLAAELPNAEALDRQDRRALKQWQQFLAHHKLAASAVQQFTLPGAARSGWALTRLSGVTDMIPLLVAAKHYPAIGRLAKQGKLNGFHLQIDAKTNARFSQLWLEAIAPNK